MRACNCSRIAAVERAHAEFELGRLGDHVVGLAGGQAPDADDGGILDRVDVAPDDALQGQHRGRRRQGLGSTARCGMAPWPPLPTKRISTLSDEAMKVLVRK